MYILMIQNDYEDKEPYVKAFSTLEKAKTEARVEFDIIVDQQIATILYQNNQGEFGQVAQANYSGRKFPGIIWS